MKLYNLNLSNFASKCRIAIYDKNLEVELAPLPGGNFQSPEYLQINPLGKVPALELDDGMVIAESEVINEYLEDRFPNPPLLPANPEARARVRSFTRFHDLYLDPPMRTLFGQTMARNRDEALVNEALSGLNLRLDLLDSRIAPEGFACTEFSLADCALAPTMVFVIAMLGAYHAKPAFEQRQRLAEWWQRVQERPSVNKVLAEMNEAYQAMQQKK
ncbi:MAG: glutathione S-transferase family protein [Candidatus Binataceae bacterium]|nr:glutathione S-transferase family protein [Candidatus Binataceae bacterium]